MTLTPADLSISAFLLYEEAQKRHIECAILEEHLIEMRKGGRKWYTRGSRTSLQSSVGKSIADNKELTKIILERNNTPTAPYQVLSSLEEIGKLDTLRYPIVMKPIDGNHGDGVIVGIKTNEDAVRELSQLLSTGKKQVIFEEMLQGVEYRVLCVNFTFLAATYRKPAFVVGDGSNTIDALIEIKNKHPWRGEGHRTPLSLIKVDALVLKYLSEQRYTLNSIPKSGTEVSLRKTANISTGGEPFTTTERVCKENKDLFEKIARDCDLNTIGIDVMCHDLSRPLSQQPFAGIIEVNASPGLRMHHFPMQGHSLNAAGKILDMVESSYKL